MKVWRFGGCKDFVGKREKLVLEAYNDLERVERTQDGSDITVKPDDFAEFCW